MGMGLMVVQMQGAVGIPVYARLGHVDVCAHITIHMHTGAYAVPWCRPAQAAKSAHTCGQPQANGCHPPRTTSYYAEDLLMQMQQG